MRRLSLGWLLAATTLAQPAADGGAEASRPPGEDEVVGVGESGPAPIESGGLGGRPLCAADAELLELRPGGVVWVLLFAEREATAFPVHRDKALRRIDVAPADAGTTLVRFEGLTCGQYAVAVVHDENGNGKLDTKIFGIPREGLGSSRDARGFFGPPHFEDAKVLLVPPRTHLPIRVTY